jgi:hypothetical protein
LGTTYRPNGVRIFELTEDFVVTNKFDIIAFNGIIGDCLTTEDEEPEEGDIDADFSEAIPPEHLEAIRQQHEAFLTRLEALAVMAIAKGYWDDVYDHISFNAPETEES